MKKQKLLALIIVCLAIFALVLPASAQAPEDHSGWWQNSDSTWSYYEYGEMCVDSMIYVDGKYYYIDENGIMLSSTWREVNGKWYYFGANGAAYTEGAYKIGGYYYGFDGSGWMYDNTDFYFDPYDENNNYIGERCYRAKEGGKLYANEWFYLDGDWYYYGADAAAYVGGAYKIGGDYYGFDWNGAMYDDEFFVFYLYDENGTYVSEKRYCAQSGGKLYVDGWFMADGEYWYCFGSDAVAYIDGVYKIGNYYYGFNYSGQMYDDVSFSIGYWDDELSEWVTEGEYRAKKGGRLYVNEWARPYDSTWYYYGAGGKAASGATTIGGKLYCFNNDGYMYSSTTVEYETASGKKWYVVDEDGLATELFNNQWRQIGTDWYCVYNGELCDYGFYTIGSTTFYFYNGRMYDDVMFWVGYYDENDQYFSKYYYAKPGGAIAKDEWIERNGEWYYFGADGAAYSEELVKAGNTYYYFYYDGSAAYNTVMETDEGVFIFNEDCRGEKVTGWVCPSWGYGWMYADGNELYKDGVYGSGANRYAFNYEGYLVADRVFYDSNTDKYYLTSPVDANGNGGKIVTDIGWKKFKGDHIYVTEDGSLHEGWLGNIYYMTPYMTYCDIVEDNGILYAMNYKGTYQQITEDGFYQVNGSTVYLESGRIVTNIWKKINDGWYYFDADGTMYAGGSYGVDGARYYFDATGKMYNGGWLRTSGGGWIYAYSNGVLHTGKDSAGYVFDSMGYLCVDEIVQLGDTWYATDGDGKSIKTFSQGWNQLGSDWYYLDEDRLVYGYFEDANGNIYYFDYGTGKMMKNRRYDNYYLGDDGKAQSGWIYDNGKWYYGDPEYKYLYWDGVYTINEKDYYFENCVLQQNETGLYNEYVITTDSEGVVVKEVLANGWTYDVQDGSGYAYYYQNGKPYTGWVGDYYIRSGNMRIDSVVEWNGNYYYLGKDGKYARSGWTERWEDEWVYARENGTLAYDEWMKIGNYWYYFDEYSMAYGGIYTIDGVRHRFADNGIWLGEDKDAAEAYPDGWNKIGGDRYFYMAGYKVTHQEIYDNGAYYYLDGNGKMITNRYRNNYNGTAYYYGANGARAKYTGWQKVDGAWVFFNQDHTVAGGWIYSGGEYYYQSYYVDVDGGYGGAGYFVKVKYKTGYAAIANKLYQFDNSGVYLRTVTATGWYYADSAWYYVENGQLVRDKEQYKIGNAYYAFDYDGQMVASSLWYGDYYGSDGKMITAAGWHAVDGKWIYIDQYGNAAIEGVYLISGKEYYFSDGIWVK